MKYKALLGLRGIMGYVTKKLVKFVAEDTPAFNSALHSSFFLKLRKASDSILCCCLLEYCPAFKNLCSKENV